MTSKDETTEPVKEGKPDPFLDADDTDAIPEPIAAAPALASASSQLAEGEWGALPLLVAFICCGFTAGIVPGQTLFVQFFAEANVFRELCSPGDTGQYCDYQILYMTQIISSFYVLMLGVQFACGGLFDIAGGRICGAVGSIVVAVSYFGIAAMVALIDIAPAYVTLWSYIVMLCVAVADIGAWLNNFALMGMIWHYPSRQKLVFALMNAAYQMGSIYAIGAQYTMGKFQISLAQLMAAWAVLQLVATICLWYSVPSVVSYQQQAEKVLGMPLPKKEKASMQNVTAAWQTLQLDWWPHTLLAWTLTFGNVYVFLYVACTLPFGTALYGDATSGASLSTFSALANGLVSVAMAPLLGYLGDRYGFDIFVQMQFGLLLLFSCTFWVPVWAFSYIAVISSVCYTSVNYMMSGSWFVKFSPANRLGLVMGVWYLLSSILFIALQTFLITWAIRLPQGLTRYMIPLSLAGELAVFSAAFFVGNFFFASPFPQKPRLLAGDDESIILKGAVMYHYGH